jgi:hypothetical protein
MSKNKYPRRPLTAAVTARRVADYLAALGFEVGEVSEADDVEDGPVGLPGGVLGQRQALAAGEADDDGHGLTPDHREGYGGHCDARRGGTQGAGRARASRPRTATCTDAQGPAQTCNRDPGVSDDDGWTIRG